MALNLRITLGGLLLLGAGTAGNAQTYTVTALGNLGAPNIMDAFGGVNSHGQVAGLSTNADSQEHAFLYDPSLGGMVDLGTLGGTSSRANGINEAGVVVGRSLISGGNQHAFRYTVAGGMQDIHSVVSLGGSQSSAVAINTAGMIVGWSEDAGGNAHAFLYNPGTSTLTDLQNLLSSGGSSSVAYGINDSGLVVLEADTATASHAFSYNIGTNTAVDLGTLGGTDSIAVGVNSSGRIVGSADVSSTAFHAFQISGPAALVAANNDIGTFGGTNSAANAVNDAGQVVGGAELSNGNTDAFLWDPVNGLRDLNNLTTGAPGWTLVEAQGISRSGFIVGFGYDSNEQQQLFLLTLPNPPVVGGVVNSASYTTPLVAGGSASIFGTNLASSTVVNSSQPVPVTLGGTSVEIEGYPAPEYLVSSGQINIQIPWEVAGRTSASLTVTTAAGTSSPVTISLGPYAPALYSQNGSGSGQGFILNADGTLNGPVHPSFSYFPVHIVANDLGAVFNQPGDGQAASASPTSGTTNPVSVTIGGLPATLTGAELCGPPSFCFLGTQGVDSSYLIHTETPQNLTAGLAVPVVVTMGSGPSAVSSNTVTIAIAYPNTVISTTASGLVYSRVTKLYDGTVTITNLTGGTFPSPFTIVFTALPAGVTLVNPTGTVQGAPYITIPGGFSLLPGRTITVPIEFSDPSNTRITFTPVVY